MKLQALSLTVVVLAFVLVGLPTARAQDEPYPSDLFPNEDPALKTDPFHVPGSTEGVGTSFTITDSDFLNVSLESSATVQVRLESVPSIVLVQIEGATDTIGQVSTLTFSGFAPLTTYYKYEDSFHNLETLTTDGDGFCHFDQDLSVPHALFIQPGPSTIDIPSNTSVGTWNPSTRKYTLTADINQTIDIKEDNLILDGANHILAGRGFIGVNVYNRTGVTVQNLTVTGCGYGIYLRYSTGCTLKRNIITNNIFGLRVDGSCDGSIVADNTASYNSQYGIEAHGNNTSATGNECDHNRFGLSAYGNNAVVSNNTASNNSEVGILFSAQGDHFVMPTRNTMLGNLYGFEFFVSNPIAGAAEIDTSNSIDGKPVYIVYNAVGDVFDSRIDPACIFAVNSSDITVRDLTLAKSSAGILLINTSLSRIENVLVENNRDGIALWYSQNNQLIGNTARGCVDGISVRQSDFNTVSGNTSSDGVRGVLISVSQHTTLTGNTFFNNEYGIGDYGGRDTLLADNIAMHNGLGIEVAAATNHVIANNTVSDGTYGIRLSSYGSATMTGNTMDGNVFGFSASPSYGYNIDTSNTVDGKPIYYVKDVVGQTFDSSLDPACIYAINCENITVRDLTLSKNDYAVCFSGTKNSLIENVLAEDTVVGITLSDSDNCRIESCEARSSWGRGVFIYESDGITLAGNAIRNCGDGIGMFFSENLRVTQNTVSSCNYGLYVSKCAYAEVFNNNVINNRLRQVYLAYAGPGLSFYLPMPAGGNFWSDWTGPDADGDWIVDDPYLIYSSLGDYLPWTVPDGWKAVPEALPVGTAVTQSPVDRNTGISIDLTFASVTQAGETVMTTSQLEGVMDPPEGYRIGDSNTIYFVSTTAVYDGAIVIVLPYATEANPALFHYVDGAWVDVTTWVDTVNKLIYGEVTSLSPFAVFELNRTPQATITAPASGLLAQLGEVIPLEAVVVDPDAGDRHAAVWTILDEDRLLLEIIPGDVTGDTVSSGVSFGESGIYFISLTVEDIGGASDTVEVVNDDPDLPAFVVVYDPSVGCVSGGGWLWSPAGAYEAAPELEGKANFGFVSKYETGATTPSGDTHFHFQAGGLSFDSTSYEWLVVAGQKAIFKGEGVFEDIEGVWKFMVSAVDGGATDRFRIKIWDDATGYVLYDNQRGDDDYAEPDSDTIIGGGNIVIHK